MITLLLGLARPPSPHDAADALAVAICHLHAMTGPLGERLRGDTRAPAARSWRDYPAFAKAPAGKPGFAKAPAGKPGFAKAPAGKPGFAKAPAGKPTRRA
jgi:hypothetical protein